MTQPTPQPGQPVPPPVDQRWPGWVVDAAIAAAWTSALSAALSGAVGAAALAAAAAGWALRGRRPVGRPELKEWLRRRYIDTDIAQAIGPAIQGALVDGWEAGARSTAAVLEHIERTQDPDVRRAGLAIVVDWSNWAPGMPDAARLVLSADGTDVGLLELLERSGQTIASVAEHRLDEIAAVLADGLEQGRTIDEIAMALRGVLDNPNWAKTTAWTETNRAMSAATLAGYTAAGIDASAWMTALDQRVCPVCGRNEDGGPTPVGEPFLSGDLHPPAHPRCRCALIPVITGDAEFDADLDELAAAAFGEMDKAAGGRNNLEQYWKRGRGRAKWVGTAHPWTNLYRGLARHMPPARAKRVASKWFTDVHGYSSGARKGKNPVGKG